MPKQLSVASNSAFNGIKLLDGTFQSQSLQVGAGNDENDTIKISIGNAKASALGVGSGSSYSTKLVGTAAVTTAAFAAGDLTINGHQVGASVADGVSYGATSNASGIAKANAINAISGSTGVIATIGKTEVTGAAAATQAIVAGDLVINGVDIGALAAGGDEVKSAAQAAAAINAKSSQTGVTATFNTTDYKITLTAVDGRNIVVAATADGTTATGLSSGTSSSKLTLTSNSKDGITVAGATGATSSKLTAGYEEATATAGAGVSSVDLTTVSGSQAALTTLDKAINTITDSRAAMGAYQNRLTATISNLETTSMNLSASRSRILDTDYAKETTNLAKSQIITQAATAMLAQANQSAQSVLALLK
jgi:flagellin